MSYQMYICFKCQVCYRQHWVNTLTPGLTTMSPGSPLINPANTQCTQWCHLHIIITLSIRCAFVGDTSIQGLSKYWLNYQLDDNRRVISGVWKSLMLYWHYLNSHWLMTTIFNEVTTINHPPNCHCSCVVIKQNGKICTHILSFVVRS